MEETQQNETTGVQPTTSTETFEQKVIRNVKAGAFAVYKTPEVVSGKTMLANIEWEDPDQVDKFFAFAKSLGAKVIYVAESEEEDEETHTTKIGIIQVGFLHDGVMHHINLDDEEEDDEDEDEEYDEEEDGEYEHDESDEESDHEEEQEQLPQTPTSQPPIQQPSNQPSQQQAPTQQTPPWPKPNF